VLGKYSTVIFGWIAVSLGWVFYGTSNFLRNIDLGDSALFRTLIGDLGALCILLDLLSVVAFSFAMFSFLRHLLTVMFGRKS
jgi:hypothetical protein